MIDLTPARISKWYKLYFDGVHYSMDLIRDPTNDEYEEINNSMKEYFKEIKHLKMLVNSDETEYQMYIFEAAFYVKALNKIDNRKSSAKKRHTVPLSFLANFGVSNTSKSNVTLRAAKFEGETLDAKNLFYVMI